MTNQAIAPADDGKGLYDGMRAMIEACCPGSDRHDQAIVAIAACIEEGIDTRPRIIGAMRQLGFDRSHAAMILNGTASPNLQSGPWQRNEEGRYSLLN